MEREDGGDDGDLHWQQLQGGTVQTDSAELRGTLELLTL